MRKEKKKMKKKIGLWILIYFLFVSGFVLAGGIKEYEYQIVSVKSFDKLEGKWFFLGGGYLKDIRCYFTYAVMPNGGLRMLAVAAASTTVFESDEVKPFIHIWTSRGSTVYEEDLFRYGYLWHLQTELHVPKGTIIKEFKIEL